ncbi:hypothetical protein AXE80_02495 [Wenyingzhuangia fucanilytica]|uniref:Secretion system C-terminal sorting domain-containing protein n=1 Tax=Wenyingzhuangia fucanilytica TaxID=1790137 RepID=A0A1B1Y391_9FLAO|nr:leucine-rich repeat domain-containing protein [Wenyingzhuangia fucanilytica]ANW95221.1 hypothetical protein AXE80_02495 [Wenyingzhuangia fucanilytica]
MKKTLKILSLALFAISFASAQTVGDTYTVGDYAYEVTSVAPNEAKVTGFSGASVSSVVIPSTAEDTGTSTTYSVVAVGANAFESDATITTVSLPSSVTTLEEFAFGTVSNLTTINLDDVEVLALKAFVVCGSLSDVGSMEKVISIGDYCFNRCTSITEYTFSSTLTTIGTGAIYNSSGNTLPNVGPETINIPSSVTSIGNLNLGGYGNLDAIQVNWTTPYSAAITNFVRYKDHSTIKLFVPDGTLAAYEASAVWGGFDVVEGTLADYVPVLTVGDGFTVGDYNYTITSQSPYEAEVAGTTNASLAAIVVSSSVVYGDDTYSVTAIGTDAFKENTTITSVSLPSSVTKIGESAFLQATNLATINTENITEIETSGLRETGVSSLDLSNLVTSGSNCLSRNYGLTSLDLPAIQELGTYVFVFNNNITSIKLGASATTFYNTSFSGLPGLTSLEMAAETPPTLPTQTQSQSTTLSNVTLIAPTSASATAYSNASGWSDFGTFTEAGSLSNELISAAEFNVYPNPVEDVVTIQNVDVISASIIGVTGKVVLSATTNTVDLSSLSSGVYLLKVTTDNNIYVERIIKK